MKIKMRSSGNLKDLNKLMRDRIVMAVATTAKAAYSQWGHLAQNELMTSRKNYLNGLQMPKIEVNAGNTKTVCRATIELTGWLPNSIEKGITSFDMKEGLLSGPKARRTIDKDGKVVRYNIIPFRHGSARSSGQNFPKINPRRDVNPRKALRDLKNSGLVPKKSRLSDFGIPPRGPRSRAQVVVRNVYAGVKKYKGRSGQGGGIFTFRIVSDNSPPSSWIHPGITGRHLARKVQRWVANNRSEYGVRNINSKIIGTF